MSLVQTAISEKFLTCRQGVDMSTLDMSTVDMSKTLFFCSIKKSSCHVKSVDIFSLDEKFLTCFFCLPPSISFSLKMSQLGDKSTDFFAYNSVNFYPN